MSILPAPGVVLYSSCWGVSGVASTHHQVHFSLSCGGLTLEDRDRVLLFCPEGKVKAIDSSPVWDEEFQFREMT